jgi:RNA polymerase sigma factor (sigma-70 family)
LAENSVSPVLRFVRRLAGGPDTVSTDGQLLGRLTDGRDSAALAALMGRYGPLVLGVCRRVLGNAHDAEDAFQATFLVLVRKAATVRRRDALGPWLHGVALRVARKAQASAVRRRVRERRVAPAAAADPGDDLARGDLRGVLDEELSRLPARYREPLVLCYFEGRTKEQAARQLGCPAGTVSARLARGRERLRVRLTRRGLAPCLALAGAGFLAHEAPAAVPPALLARTVRGVLQLAAGRAADPVLLSGQAAALADGVTRSMFRTKLSIAAALVLALGVAGGVGVRARARPAAAETPAPAEKKDKADREPGLPKGWFGGSAKQDEYESGLDRKVVHGGKASAYVRMKDVGDADFGTLGQAFRADDYRGKRVRLSAWLKTRDVSGGAALWMRVDGPGKTLAFDNMDKRRVTGSKDWARYEVVLDVPEEAKHITIGMLVGGKGQAWVDDFKLEVVDKKVKSTDLLEKPFENKEAGESEVPDKPVNLDFEDADGK